MENNKFEKNKVYLVGGKNKNRHIVSHYPYLEDDSDFNAGFFEAMDMFKYIWTYFSLFTCDELWPPKSDYDKNKAYQFLLDGKKILSWNFFWEKFENEDRSPWKFYDSLDNENKSVLYAWYKKNIKKD